ncbi:uncharacterized protein LOC134267643 [Saccostrea cucullata]|uniref:uncharacterized protein LOC134267643 n=1 Tax=Saccostrea cuccullata TaxID=36930 RepID=UPI002ED4CF54
MVDFPTRHSSTLDLFLTNRPSLEDHIPSKLTFTRYSQPWVNNAVKRISRQKNRSFRKARKTGKKKDNDRYQRPKKEAKNTCQSAYNEYIKNIIRPDASSNPKRFWSFIKGKRTEASGVSSLNDKHGVLISDSEKKANILNGQFFSVFIKEEKIDNIPDKGPVATGPITIPGHECYQHQSGGIRKLLAGLNPYKATGPNNVPCRLLREFADEITPVFQLLFQASVNQVTIPADWKSANVVPNYKKGDKENRRTTDSTGSGQNIDNKGQTDVILLDFSKAFDKVPHKRLLYKLSYYGIRGCHLQWIEDFLTGRIQQVLLEGKTSDDCALYRDIKNEDDAAQLQKDLDGLQRWEKEWMMEFHPGKCQVLHVTNKRKVVNVPYAIHGHVLEVVETAKYLGIYLHQGLKWNHHIDTIAKKANPTFAFLRRNLHQCPSETKALCYQTLVRPILEYGSTIWDPYTRDSIGKLEMVQRRTARMVTSNYRTTSSVTDMLQQLQWTSLQERRGQAKAVMMYRIVYQLIDIPPLLLFPATTTRGNSIMFLVPYARTLVYQKSFFFPDGILVWNYSLPSP